MAMIWDPYKPTIMIGIDFGTTFTGVAHSYSIGDGAKKAKIDLVKWPGGAGTAEKTPTRFAYSCPENRLRWGYAVEVGDPAIEYIKLLLDKTQQVPQNIKSKIELALSQENKTVDEAISDFLHEIYLHIESRLIAHYRQSVLMGAERYYVFTVPACWSQAPQERITLAARKAGYPGYLHFVAEPEAAALWTLRSNPDIYVPATGHVVVICDVGGGTTDIISYEMCRLRPLMIKEAIPGTGGEHESTTRICIDMSADTTTALSGGVNVNEAFETLICNKMGLKAFRVFREKNSLNWHEAMKIFEEKRRRFNPEDFPDKTFTILCAEIGEDKDANFQQNTIVITTEEMKQMFQPVVDTVIKLCRDQVDELRSRGKNVATLVLVGGFGRSDYLLGEVRKAFAAEIPDILQPDDGWSAIAKGSIVWAREGASLIESRQSRYNYGITYRKQWDGCPEKTGFNIFWDDIEEKYYRHGLFRTFIAKSQTLSMNEPITHGFQTYFLEGQERIRHTKLLLSSSEEEPTLATELDVRPFCTLKTNLFGVPERHFERKINSKGVRYYRINYDLKMQLESSGLKFSCEIDGVEYGTVTRDFE